GDFAVSQYAGVALARTIGARVHAPALDLPARQRDENLFYKVPAIERYPFDGSAIVIWDSGPGLVDPPPITNTPPSRAHYPHGAGARAVAARTQIYRFLRPGGAVTDVCNGAPCHTDVYAP